MVALRSTWLGLVALAVAARGSTESDLAESYRDECAADIAPASWSVEEDGEWEAPANWKPHKDCPVQLTPAAFKERCAPHEAPEDWDEEEDGVFEPPPDLAVPTCVVAFVPVLGYDEVARRRMATLGAVMAAARKEPRPLEYLWSVEGDQPALEAALGVGTYPVLALYNAKREAGAVMRHAFTADNMASFLTRASIGRAEGVRSFSPPELQEPEVWDGRDIEMPRCGDEMKYDDVELEVDF
mmetsp:Transcript_13269/g.45004  ORF Transcript_13269/g.45004 Transcript_13269/m.45004 type:complete len:241 (-) Transcript_13269:218-940(-)